MTPIRRTHRSSPTPLFGIRSFVMFIAAIAVLVIWIWLRVQTGEKNPWLLALSAAIAFAAFAMSVYGIFKTARKRKID